MISQVFIDDEVKNMMDLLIEDFLLIFIFIIKDKPEHNQQFQEHTNQVFFFLITQTLISFIPGCMPVHLSISVCAYAGVSM